MKIEEMVGIFLNSANFASHVLLTLAPPSNYALNLKALIKVSKAEHLSFHVKYLDLRLKKKWWQTSFFQKEHFPKARVSKGKSKLVLTFVILHAEDSLLT